MCESSRYVAQFLLAFTLRSGKWIVTDFGGGRGVRVGEEGIAIHFGTKTSYHGGLHC